MNRTTVLLSAAFIALVSPVADASTVFVAKVRSVPTSPNGAAIMEFRHNDNPGRAWVSVTLCGKFITGDPEASDCPAYNQYRFHVPGLTYDKSSGAIRLGSHVCATVEPGLGRPVDRETGQCQLSIHTVRQDVGNGGSWDWMDEINIELR